MKPTLVLEPEVHQKVMHWVHKSPVEVSGLGLVQIEPNGILRVIDAMLLPQKNGATHTDIEAEEVTKAMYELRHKEGLLQWWWHSHVNMGVFWSGTDHDTIRKIGSGGWFSATVFNKKGEMRSAYYSIDGQVTPWGASPLFLDELETSIGVITNDKLQAWDAEYKKNVDDYKRVVPIVTPSTWPMGSTHQARPEGMSKKEWKRQKRERRILETPQTELIDDYGFDQEERTILSQAGWDQNDIDFCVNHDLTPAEILRCVDEGMQVQEVRFCLAQGYTPRDLMQSLDDDIEMYRRDQRGNLL